MWSKPFGVSVPRRPAASAFRSSWISSAVGELIWPKSVPCTVPVILRSSNRNPSSETTGTGTFVSLLPTVPEFTEGEITTTALPVASPETSAEALLIVAAYPSEPRRALSTASWTGRVVLFTTSSAGRAAGAVSPEKSSRLGAPGPVSLILPRELLETIAASICAGVAVGAPSR
jgi:hypothetical protein